MRYEPVNPTVSRERGKYAMYKWWMMDDDQREPLRQHIDRLLEIKHLGELGALELLLTLGTFLNERERVK